MNRTKLNPSAIAPESISREMLNKEVIGELSGKVELYVLDFTIWDVESLYQSGVPGSVIRVDADALSDAIDQGKIIAIKTDSSFNGLTIVDAYKEDMIYLVFSSYGGCYSVDVELNGEFRLDNIGYFSYSGVTETLRELSGGVQENAKNILNLERTADELNGEVSKNKNSIINLQQSVDELSEVVQTNEESIESLEVIVEDLQNMKIDKEADDYYPQLSVGLADNLAGREDATPSEIGFRKSGGGAILDGNARIESIKGNSVVWNQTYQPRGDRSSKGVSHIIEGNQITFSGIVNEIGTGATLNWTEYTTIPIGHKFTVMTSLNLPSSVYLKDSYNGYNYANKIATKKEDFIVIQPYFTSVGTDMNGVQGYISVIDLTQMFGAGNEPTSVEEFYARIPQNIDLYAYNEGEVIHNTTDAVKSVGFNQWDEEWSQGYWKGDSLIGTTNTISGVNFYSALPNQEYVITSSNGFFSIYFYDRKKTLVSSLSDRKNGSKFTIPSGCAYFKFSVFGYGDTYNNDICINLSDSSRNGTYEPYISREQRLDIIGKYFPNGMKSAGTAHDEIRYNKATQKWEAVKRIGEVDLGTTSPAIQSTNSYGIRNWTILVSSTVPDIAKVAKPNVMCRLQTQRTGISATSTEGIFIEGVTSDVIYIRLKSERASTVAEFQSAMNGVMLYYELAEPIVTEIEEDINLDYEVWNGGTEEAIADTPSTPLKADIVYGFNAYGVIKDLREQVAAMQAMMAQMRLAMASMTTPASMDETPPSEE